MKINNISKLVIAIVISELAGVIGAFFTTPSIPTWYATLVKPALNPPAWVFAPVWTILFALMGIAAFLVWKRIDSRFRVNSKNVRTALEMFALQLALNVLWSAIFFGLHDPGAAFVEMIILWLAILGTIVTFARLSKLAAWLLIPYILWVSFAGYLCYSIWQLSI